MTENKSNIADIVAAVQASQPPPATVPIPVRTIAVPPFAIYLALTGVLGFMAVHFFGEFNDSTDAITELQSEQRSIKKEVEAFSELEGTINAMSAQQGLMSQALTGLTESVGRLSAQTADRYTSKQAESDNAISDRNSKDIEAIEDELDDQGDILREMNLRIKHIEEN